MKTIQYTLQDGIATITFDEPNSPVNTMCLQWQEDMSALAAQVLKDKDAIKGILLASAKSTFFAGADLKATMRLQPSQRERLVMTSYLGGHMYYAWEASRRAFRADVGAFYAASV